MESSIKKTAQLRKKRAFRVRKKLHGTAEKPRLCVIKTNRHVHAQLINDDESATIASASTISKEFRVSEHNRKSTTAAKEIGIQIAKLAKNKSVKKIVFDRGPFKYHGINAAVAEGAREGGLEF